MSKLLGTRRLCTHALLAAAVVYRPLSEREYFCYTSGTFPSQTACVRALAQSSIFAYKVRPFSSRTPGDGDTLSDTYEYITEQHARLRDVGSTGRPDGRPATA